MGFNSAFKGLKECCISSNTLFHNIILAFTWRDCRKI